MSKTAFLFTGQGAQYIGMGKDLYENFAVFKDIFDNACEHLKIDLRSICFDGELAALSKTQNLQPAIVTISYGIYKLLEKENIVPSAVAGFSLGEMSALASLGILDFNDALNLVKIRGEVMEKACGYKSGAMYSIIGLEDTAVEEICKDIRENTGGYVIPANYNCPGQIVISGEAEAAEAAAKSASEKGAKTVKLNVSGAFHSKLMKHGKDVLTAFIQTLNFNVLEKDAPIDFYSNVTGEKIDLRESAFTKVQMREFMADYIPKQMSSPVKFQSELKNMSDNGIDTFIEIGAGKVLSGFVRRTNKAAKFMNVEDSKTLTFLFK